MLGQSWASVVIGGPTLTLHCTQVSCWVLSGEILFYNDKIITVFNEIVGYFCEQKTHKIFSLIVEIQRSSMFASFLE